MKTVSVIFCFGLLLFSNAVLAHETNIEQQILHYSFEGSGHPNLIQGTNTYRWSPSLKRFYPIMQTSPKAIKHLNKSRNNTYGAIALFGLGIVGEISSLLLPQNSTVRPLLLYGSVSLCLLAPCISWMAERDIHNAIWEYNYEIIKDASQ